MSTIHNPDSNAFLISKGLIPGTGCFDSLGERDAVDQKVQGVDVWRGTADFIPEPPDVGEQMSLVSTSANDDKDAGTGVRRVRIEYIDAAGDEQTEDIDLEGLTAVDTVATDIRFVNAIHAIDVGSNGVADGDITIYQFGAPATVYNTIIAGGNMSVTISRMIPAGHSFYLTGWNGTSTTQNKQVTLRIRSTSRNGVLEPGVYLFIDSATLEVNTYSRVFACPVKIPGLAIIKVSAWALQVGTNVSASFDGYLIED